MKIELQMIVLAALLHDIGKFAQRAKRPYSKEMEATYLTYYKGRSGHWHSLYTDYFIEHDLPLPKHLEAERGKIARFASAHHRPDEENVIEMAIALADRLSAGTDRIAYHAVDDHAGFRELRLLSIFDEVELSRHRFAEPGNWYHTLMPLETSNDAIFPVEGEKTGDPQKYKELFDTFRDAIQKLDPMLPFTLYLDSLVAILEKYTWCIPSSTYETLPDISLFDHSLMTATIAQALYLYHTGIGTVPKENDQEDKFILLGGDLSGIQEYIFKISKNTGKGVSKIFRARSFYLQAVVKSALISLQNRLGLLGTCKVMDAGGKFLLLLPNLETVRNTLSMWEGELQLWFRSRFKGLLTLNVAQTTLMKQGDFTLPCFQVKLDEANEDIDRAKYKKLDLTIKSEGPVIGEDYDEREGGNCAICTANAMDPSSTKGYSRDSAIETPICGDCYQQIDYIGRYLPQRGFHLYGNQGEVELFDTIRLTLSEREPASFENIYYIDTFSDESGFTRARLARHMPLINDEELRDRRWFDLFNKETGDADLEADQPKTFTMLAQKSRKEFNGDLIGRPLLGFMKADVDNLGFIFGLGLGDRLSIARFSFLSRMLNLFFSDYLVELIKREYPEIYVVFAGGDDLFVVGPWDQTIRFAVSLRRAFSRFCAENADITLSAGIRIARPRYPMRRAVDDVGNILGKSKDYKVDGHTKDAVSLLGETLPWERLEDLLALGEKFDRAIEEKERTRFSTAFLYRLLEYYEMYRRFIDGGDIPAGRYLSHAHYDIGRNIVDAKADNAEELAMLREIFAVGGTEKPLLDKLYIPLFFAANRNRKET